jgi:hypothetical protein
MDNGSSSCSKAKRDAEYENADSEPKPLKAGQLLALALRRFVPACASLNRGFRGLAEEKSNASSSCHRVRLYFDPYELPTAGSERVFRSTFQLF